MVTVYNEDAKACRVVAMIIGFNADPNGTKLARLLPAR